MANLNDNAINEFLSEIDDLTQRIATGLAAVENDAQAASSVISAIYRDTHTIKGSAQLFGCGQMAQLAHAMETTFDAVRGVQAGPTRDWISATYQCLDVIVKLAASLRQHRKEIDVGAELAHLIPLLAQIATDVLGANLMPMREPALGSDHLKLEKEVAMTTKSSVAAPEVGEKKIEKVVVAKEPVDNDRASASGADSAAETIRVQVTLLDNLMNLVGELVLIRNQVVQYTQSSADEADFLNLAQRLNVVTTELQNEVMKTRMQPIGNILSKFQRIVRDMARDLSKDIDLKLEGTETELDKKLIEAVKDPLTHIVRNSVDHGVEMPADRQAKGKSPKGQILIRSYHEGGQVVIEIVDDGRGLSRKKIGDKAVEKGLVSAEALAKMSDREIYNLIFAPGFSTAEKISNISGRGVGMDVVRTNIEKIGGVVDINTIEGQGTTIKLKIPLTLAIVPALIIKSANERFAIPQVKLVELVRIENNSENSEQSLQMLQGQPVFRLRGSLLPLASINEVLKLDGSPVAAGTAAASAAGRDGEATNIAVLSAESGLFGLIVDSIEDSTDIVVKPISSAIKSLGVYSGATVLGDGSVALVLDVVGLASTANILDSKAHDTKAESKVAEQQRVTGESSEYLVVDIGAPGRYAIPLCLVNRLEEFSAKSIELSGERRVVRYRGKILPLISTAEKLGLQHKSPEHGAPASENIQVVVVEQNERYFGLEVRSILDVIAMEENIDRTVKDRPCIYGTAVHADGVVVVIDVFKIIEGTFAGKDDASATLTDLAAHERSKHHVLVVEDSDFFRNHVTQILADAGFKVTSDVDGEFAFSRLSKSNPGDYTLVISDIEMPRMNGVELAQRVRSDLRFKSLPMIAFTTKSSKSDEERGRAAGFNMYLRKQAIETLVGNVDQALGIAKKEQKYGT